MAGVDRLDPLVDAHVHAAEFLDDLVEPAEVDHGGAVELDAGELGQRRGQQLYAARALPAVLERGVDLVRGEPPNRIRHGGMFTRRSRGIEIEYARSSDAGMCTMMIVSDRAPMPGLFARASEPISR